MEISHEVLLTAWPLLRDTWLAETHADRIVRTRLRNAAAEWARRSRDPSYLYRGTLLQAAAEAAARIGADPARNPPLSPGRTGLPAAPAAVPAAARHPAAERPSPLSPSSRWPPRTTAVAFRIAGISARNAAAATQQRAVALSRQLAAESPGRRRSPIP